MQQEQQKKKEAKPKPPNKAQRIFDDLFKTTLNTKQTSNNPRRILAGSVLATCLAFLIAMLTQKIDVTLFIASCLFAAPIPFLVIGFIIASYDFEDQRLQLLSSIVFMFEKVGMILAALGILFVEYHISSYVFWSTLFSFFVFLLIAAFILVRRGVHLGIPQVESEPLMIDPPPSQETSHSPNGQQFPAESPH